MSFLTANSAPSTRTVNDYAELKRRIKAAGLLDPQPLYYLDEDGNRRGHRRTGRRHGPSCRSWWMLALDGVFMGFASTQVALLAHDVGHRQGYRGRTTNAIAEYVFGNVLLGVSPSWWNEKHNQHHATPNHIDKDPDIQFPDARLRARAGSQPARVPAAAPPHPGIRPPGAHAVPGGEHARPAASAIFAGARPASPRCRFACSRSTSWPMARCW